MIIMTEISMNLLCHLWARGSQRCLSLLASPADLEVPRHQGPRQDQDHPSGTNTHRMKHGSMTWFSKNPLPTDNTVKTSVL